MKNNFNAYIKVSIFTLMIILSSSWLSDGLKGDCLFKYAWDFYNINSCELDRRIQSFVFTFVIFFLFTWLLFQEGPSFFYKNLKSSEVKSHRVLIMAVSKLTPAPPILEPNGKIRIYYTDKPEKFVEITGNIENDIEEFNEKEMFSNIQQLLRAVKPHHNTLERIYLIGSAGDDGSYKHREIVMSLLSCYKKKNNFEIKIGEDGIKFEDVEKLHEEYERLVTESKKDGYRENEIILDATAGMKTTSIAAAIMTFNHKNLKFQYVETGKNPKVLAFNIVAYSSPSKLS